MAAQPAHVEPQRNCGEELDTSHRIGRYKALWGEVTGYTTDTLWVHAGYHDPNRQLSSETLQQKGLLRVVCVECANSNCSGLLAHTRRILMQALVQLCYVGHGEYRGSYK